MKHLRIVQTAACTLALGSALAADPHIGYVYPAGGRQGSSFEVEFGGQFIEKATQCVASIEGIQCEYVGFHRVLDVKEIGQYRRRMERIEREMESMEPDKRKRASEDLKRIRQTLIDNGFDPVTKKRTRRPDPKKQPNAQIAERVTLRLTIDPHIPTRACEVRLKTPDGMTNPLFFHIGQLPECTEQEPNDLPATTNQVLKTPCLVNGQIMPGDVDRFTVHARKGQELVFETKARHLVPYLADAVPGWFQAVLCLYDEDGEEIAYSDDYRFDPDPVLFFEVPRDGAYTVEIRDAIYRGREDFVYRLAIGELPFITEVFPLGSQKHTTTNIWVNGRNIPYDRASLEIGEEPVDMCLSPAARGGLRSNPVRFSADDLPGMDEQEPNDTLSDARDIERPVMINGRIQHPGDWDVYSLYGQAGERLALEVYARRLGSPLDSIVQIMDRRGGILSINDDCVDPASGLATHHADSHVVYELPDDGYYRIRIGDLQGKGGPSYAYRLRITDIQPDYELRVFPSAISLPAGGTAPVTLCAIRRDGFAGAIDCRLTSAPEGFELQGARIPVGIDRVRCTLHAPYKAEEGTLELKVEGAANIDGKEVCRRALPADDVMQAFLYRHLVTADQWVVAIHHTTRIQLLIDPIQNGALDMSPGDRAVITVRTPGKHRIHKAPRFELDQPPPGWSLADVKIDKQNRVAELTLELSKDAEDTPHSGNLIIQALAAWNKKKKIVLGTLPAIPFEIHTLSPEQAGVKGSP